MVKQYGIRKWAQIAEKMVGRAGKQCRERWHNHLRPDIKVFFLLLFWVLVTKKIFSTLFYFFSSFVIVSDLSMTGF